MLRSRVHGSVPVSVSPAEEREAQAQAWIENIYWGEAEDVFVLFSRAHIFDLMIDASSDR